jgi:dsRNA-specific ribonuclease
MAAGLRCTRLRGGAGQLTRAAPAPAPQINLVSNEVLARRAMEAGLQPYLRLLRYDARVWSRADTVAALPESQVRPGTSSAQLAARREGGGGAVIQLQGAAARAQPGTAACVARATAQRPASPAGCAPQAKGKRLADLVEALMGLYHSRAGLQASLALAEHLQVLPPGSAANVASLGQPKAEPGTAEPWQQKQPQQPEQQQQQQSLHASKLQVRPRHCRQPRRRLPALTNQHLSGCSAAPPPCRRSPPRAQTRPQEAQTAVQRLLGRRIQSSTLLREALTHCSSPVGPCYQRLEFLGDALLDLCVSTQLWTSHRWVASCKLAALPCTAPPGRARRARGARRRVSPCSEPATRHAPFTHARAQHSTAQHSTAQHSTAQHSSAQLSPAQLPHATHRPTHPAGTRGPAR